MANISEILINAPLGSVSANFWDYINSDIQENLITLTHNKQRSVPGLNYYQLNNYYLGGVGWILIREVKKDFSNIEHSVETVIKIEKRETIIQLIMPLALYSFPKDLPNFLDKIIEILKSEKFMDLICSHNIMYPTYKLGLFDLPDFVYLDRSEDPRIMNGHLTFTVSYDKSSTRNEALRIIWRKGDEVLKNKFIDSIEVAIQEQKENILRMVIDRFFGYLQRKGIGVDICEPGGVTETLGREKSAKSATSDKPSRKKSIENACIQWAGRGYLPSYNLETFLSEYEDETGDYIGKSEFKRALRDAGKKGLIKKVNSRWRSVNSA